MKETLLFFIQGIPEMTGVIALCFAIARVRINWVRTLAAGTAIAILSYTIQSLSFFFGFHTFLIMFLIMLYLTRVGQIPIVYSFFATSVSSLALVILEFSTNSIFFRLLNINPQDATANQFFWAIIGLPQALVIILLAIVVSNLFKPIRRVI